MRPLLRSTALAVVLAVSLLACKDKKPELLINAKIAPKGLAAFKGRNTLQGEVLVDGVLPAGTRVMLAVKSAGPKDAGLRTLDDGGDFTRELDLTEPTSRIPFEIDDLSDGSYRLKMIAMVDLKERLKDPARRAFGKGDYAGVFSGVNAVTQDLRQARPIEVKNTQTVDLAFRIGKIQ